VNHLSTVKRPALRWHGGKWLLAPWIISHFPAHRVYVEPYGGAASVLLRKPPSYAEVYNDLDGSVVNFFKVLRGDRAQDLIEALRMTPFSRAEFSESYTPHADPVEQARRLVIRSFLGFGSNSHQRRSGFRGKGYRAGTLPQDDWRNFADALSTISERLRAGVVIEQEPAITVMRRYDEPFTLHYVDPPYVAETRDAGKDYAHEMSADDHAAMLDCLNELSGYVILSGYENALYGEALSGWSVKKKKHMADGARERTEVIWINPSAAKALSDGLLL